jgi:AraC-like DNA-binding protein
VNQTQAKPDFLSTQVLESRRYFLNLTPAPTKGITVVCGGCEHCEPDYRIDRKGFPFYGIEFVAKGEGELRLMKREYHLRPGMVFAYGPRMPHRIQNDRHAPMVKYYIDFVGDKAVRLLNKSPLGGGKAAQVSDPHQVYEVFELLHRNGIGDSPFSNEICAILLELLLLKISEKAVLNAHDDTRALVSYQRCKQYIEQYFAGLKSLAEVAQATHVDVSYLCRLFQRFDHASPYQCLMRLKMNRAAELLLDQGLRVKEVAAELRFSDPYNFSRAFKHVYGLSPERFLKQGHRLGT